MENLGKRLRKIKLAVAATDFRQLAERCLVGEANIRRPSACPFDQGRCHALIVIHQHLAEALGDALLVPVGKCLGLRGLDKPADAFRVFFHIHGLLLYMPRPSRRAAVDPDRAPDSGKPLLMKQIWVLDLHCKRPLSAQKNRPEKAGS